MPGFGDRLTCVSENFYEKERNTHTRTQKNPRRKIAHSKDEKVGLKSQSAMEYLMTYGWAILIIAIVLVAFFSLNLFNPYTFSPKASPGSCQILRPNGPGSNLFVSAVGPTCTTNEIPQYVASFNGGNSNIYLNSNTVLAGSSAITISLWFNAKSIQASQNGWLDEEGLFGLKFNQPNTLLFCYAENNSVPSWSACVNDVYSFSPNKWYNIIVTWPGGSDGFFYVNGVTPNGGIPIPIGTLSGLHSVSYFEIGPAISGIPASSSALNGTIANVQIYNTSLSQPEVTALYQEGIGGAPIDLQHLVGWWPLNGNSNDYSGNGNNGVPTSVTFTSSWENGYSTP